MKTYSSLAITDPDKLIFGAAPKPVTTRRGLVIGGGKVYPEVNFTLPSMAISAETLPAIRAMYRDVVDDVCKRAVELEQDGLVIELETLIEMTTRPSIAIGLTTIVNEVLEDYYQKHGLKGALRITPNDARELVRPPYMRSGELLEKMLETFEGCARAGADLLAIESTGGKEVHDDALLSCNAAGVMLGLSVMGTRDMAFLWKRIVDVTKKTNTIAAGDTGCGFGNSAMVLSEKRYIPKVFAAVDRVVTIVRSLVAYEQGARGPGKDCGYENPFLKAITGYPMAMEGKTAACAHLSPLGNVAAATCDLWSNESVQNVKLLGGMAPTIYAEQLIYDCRLMNVATLKGQALALRDQMVDSDVPYDPQALILAPANVIRIAGVMVKQPDYYRAARAGALEALALIDEEHKAGRLRLGEMEVPWVQMLKDTIGELPDNEDAFVKQVLPTLDVSKFRPEEYGLAL